MSFLSPYWLILLVLIPLIIGIACLAQIFSKKSWKQFVAPRLKNHLSLGRKQGRYWIGFSLHLLALCFLILAIARPSSGSSKVELKTHSHNVFILLDTSLSMLSQDVSPSRIDLAHAQAISIIDALPHAQIGLASFSGNLQLNSPYSRDHEAIKKILNTTKPDPKYTSGSNLSTSISSMLQVLQEIKSPAQALIIISDGEEHGTIAKEAIQLAKQQETRIFTIGVGTTTGATIPYTKEKDGKYKDLDGSVVYTKLVENSLKQLAKATGGTYTNASKQGLSRLQYAIEGMKKTSSHNKTYQQPNESFTWFLVTSVGLLVLGAMVRINFRKVTPLAFITISAFSFFPSELKAQALPDQDVSLKEQFIDHPQQLRQGRDALSHSKYKTAIENLEASLKSAKGDSLAEIHFSIGEAKSKMNLYSEAQTHFAKALLHPKASIYANASHNLANMLFLPTWQKLAPPKDQEFEAYLTANLIQLKLGKTDKLPFSLATISQAKIQWTDAIQYYQTAYQSLAKLQKSKENETTVQQLLDTLIRAEAEADRQVEKIKDQQKKEQDKKNTPKPPKDNKPKDPKEQPKENKPKEPKEQPKDPKNGNKPKDKGENGQNKKPKNGESGDKKKPNKIKPKPEEKSEDKTQIDKKGDDSKPALKPSDKELKKAEALELLQEVIDQQHSPFKANLNQIPRSKHDW